jgi:hypothetical protein
VRDPIATRPARRSPRRPARAVNKWNKLADLLPGISAKGERRGNRGKDASVELDAVDCSAGEHVAGGLVRHSDDAWIIGRGKRGIQGAARRVTTPELDRALMEVMQQGRHLGFWVGGAGTSVWGTA